MTKGFDLAIRGTRSELRRIYVFYVSSFTQKLEANVSAASEYLIASSTNVSATLLWRFSGIGISFSIDSSAI
ncbi:MAG TPA: hypothetical protein VGR94_01230 [Candidatus Acidoferrales bacterium]|nr:hypothetical protein [Candidatus Acidoferrales bacterium]